MSRSTADTSPNDQHRPAGGFDVMLGNPPWERVKLQEKEWFATRHFDIATASNVAKRKRMIKALEAEDPPLHTAFLDACRVAEGNSHFLRDSGRYPLCGRGDVNTYTVFTELFRDSLSPRGRSGCVVPSGIATDDTTKYFFQSIVDRKNLVSLFDFENAARYSRASTAVTSSAPSPLVATTGRGTRPPSRSSCAVPKTSTTTIAPSP